MKKVVIAILTLAVMIPGAKLSAQGKYGADSADCIKYLSYYSEYYKQKNYDEALPNWRKAYKYCPPQASQNLLLHGTTLLRRVITQNAKNPDLQKAVIDSLLTLHDQRAQFYPKNAAAALNNKATDANNYIKDEKALYDVESEIIKTLQANAKPSVLFFQFKSAVDLYQNKGLEADVVINDYQNVMDLLSQISPATDADKEQWSTMKSNIETLFMSSKVASCENLIELFTPRFNANPEDINLLGNIVGLMNSAENCSDNDLYLNAVTNMYKLNPTHTSAYGLFKLNSSRGNIDEAVKYMEEAIASSESDSATDGKYNYELAVVCFKNGQSAKAFEAARKAIELNPEYEGKSDLLIAQIWANAGCGGDEISRRAPYWVAVDYLQKAKAADASLEEEATRLIRAYSGYYPQTAEAFMYDVTDGQSYTVSCAGMRATTTVRTQK